MAGLRTRKDYGKNVAVASPLYRRLVDFARKHGTTRKNVVAKVLTWLIEETGLVQQHVLGTLARESKAQAAAEFRRIANEIDPLKAVVELPENVPSVEVESRKPQGVSVRRK